MTTWIKPAIFGTFDGIVTVLGVVCTLLHHPDQMFPVGCSVAAAGAVSMAGGEWLSDSDNGFLSSAVIGITSGVGTLLPVLPYAFTTAPHVSMVLSISVYVVVGLVIASFRTDRGRWRAIVETLSVLIVASAAAAIAAFMTGATG